MGLMQINASQEQQKKSIQQQIANIKRRLQQLQSQSTKIESQKSDLAQKHSQSVSRVSHLEQQKNESQRCEQDLSEKLQSNKLAQERDIQQHKELQKSLREIGKEIVTTNQLIKYLSADKEQLEKSISLLISEKGKKEKENEYQQGELQRINQNKEKIELKIGAIKEEKQSNLRQYQDASSKLSNAVVKHGALQFKCTNIHQRLEGLKNNHEFIQTSTRNFENSAKCAQDYKENFNAFYNRFQNDNKDYKDAVVAQMESNQAQNTKGNQPEAANNVVRR